MVEIVVKAVICSGQRILALKRAPHASYPGRWDLPGGHIIDGETLLEVLEREVREEVRLRISEPVLLNVHSYCERRGSELDGRDAGKSVIVVTYLIGVHEGEVRISDEHTEFAWVRPSELSDGSLHPGLLPAFALLRKHVLQAPSL